MLAFSDEFAWAAALLSAAIVLDIADGAVARLVGALSPFGVQLDSLADPVSFGVAPAVLVHSASGSPTVGSALASGRRSRSSGPMSLDRATGSAWNPGDLTGLDESSHAYTRTVDALTEEQLALPSLLPGWTRAHVVAHVALNGFSLAAVIDGLVHGHPVAMYESDQQRDRAVEELAHVDPSELRERHLVATTEFADAVARMDASHWSGRIDRLPGGPAWPMVTVVPTRRRELEIHHVDLGTSYTRADWPDDFVVELLDAVTVDHASDGPFRVHATDLGRDWFVGDEGGPTVMGRGSDLGWWLTGRGAGEGLASESGELPVLGPWRRASGTVTSRPTASYQRHQPMVPGAPLNGPTTRSVIQPP